MDDELVHPEMLKKLGKWRSCERPWVAIQKDIENELKRKITIPSIQKAYEVYSRRSAEIISGDEDLKGMLRDTVIDQTEQLKEINDFVRQLMREMLAESSRDTKAGQVMLNAAREIREQISLQAKLLNNMQEGFNFKQINQVEYTQISTNNLKELEKEGYIRILRRPGEVYDVEAKEVVSINKEEMNQLNHEGVVIVGNYSIQVVENESDGCLQKSNQGKDEPAGCPEGIDKEGRTDNIDEHRDEE